MNEAQKNIQRFKPEQSQLENPSCGEQDGDNGTQMTRYIKIRLG